MRVELVRRERVIDVVGVALLAIFLIDQRLNASHRWRGKRCSAAALQVCGVQCIAGRAVLLRVRHTLDQEASPEAVRGEERQIGLVAQAIVRNARHARLPRRLRIALAGSADHAGNRRDSREAGARSATATVRIVELSAVFRVAEAAWTIRLRVTAVDRIAVEQLAGAAVVPRNLRNIRQRGRFRYGVVLRAPIFADGNVVGVPEVLGHEIGAAHIDRIGGSGIAVSYTHLDVYKRQLSDHTGGYSG